MSYNILITGGTGSFGQELVKLLLNKNHCDKIIIYSRDEQKQEIMARRFNNDSRLRFFIGDVRDKERLDLALHDVMTVVHAAALKIVPAGEYNPFEFVKTNILGTQNVINAFATNGFRHSSFVRRMIMLSTDKAVQPINLYGATKLAAEKLTLAANNSFGQYGPQFSVVRYGNVAGSNGSVIPVFKELLKQGKPLTITDPNMTRYWITLDEAVQFVYNSLDKMQGGETFIPDMPSFYVTDLAYAMSPESYQQIIGVRPGEKIHETLDGVKFSNQNETWLGSGLLGDKLKEMGVIQ